MLTDLLIKKLSLPEKRRELPDGKISGLYLVAQPSGAKSFAVRYRIDGAPRKFTLGAYPSLDLAAARKQAQKVLGDIAAGKDPAAIKKASRASMAADRAWQIDRVDRVVALFVERYAKPKTRDWRETERMLTKEVAARWEGARLSQITRAHVHEMLDEIVDRGAPIRANRVFAQVRKMCRWAISRGIIDRSPCEGLTRPSVETKRERVLSDNEIRLVWRAFDAVGWPFGAIGKLLLLTGARRDEVAKMRWSEIEIASRTWTLPGDRTKNRRLHIIPLTDAAISILQCLPRIGERGPGFVFTTTGRTAVSGFSHAKRAIDAAMLEATRGEAGAPCGKRDDGPAPHWTVHDLRRTVATNLQRLGVKLEVTEAILNHVSGSRAGIVGVYQRHDYDAEKRSALEAWCQHLEILVSGERAGSLVDVAKRTRRP
jgi:integrase